MTHEPKKILVIAAHADDEALGCGGTLARHSAAGDTVKIIFLADGVSARGSIDGLEARKECARVAAQHMGADLPIFLDLPDNRLDSLPLLDVIEHIVDALDGYAPQVVYTHFAQDLNIDHRIAHQATMTLFRPKPDSSVETILCFETSSSTEWQTPSQTLAFTPQYFVDVGAHFVQKINALEAYAVEIAPFPNSRSIEAVEALATYRGASMGCARAEAFMVARHINKG